MIEEKGFIYPDRDEVEEEVYSMLGIRFEILKAWQHLKKNPREPKTINVDSWGNTNLSYLIVDGEPVYKNMGEVKASKYQFNMGTGIDWKFARNISKEKSQIPGIVVTFEQEGNTIPLMIDGHHRLGYHLINGIELMTVYVLDPEESEILYPESIKRLRGD